MILACQINFNVGVKNLWFLTKKEEYLLTYLTIGGHWSRILEGVELAGKSAASIFGDMSAGGLVGSAVGPEGTVIGTLVGGIMGAVGATKNIMNFINHKESPGGPTPKQLSDHLRGSDALAVVAAHPHHPVIQNVINGARRGLPIGAAMLAAGVSRVPGRIADGGAMSVMNKTHATSGVHPRTAMVLGNSTLRAALAKTPKGTVQYAAVRRAAHGAAYAAGADMSQGLYPGGSKRPAMQEVARDASGTSGTGGGPPIGSTATAGGSFIA